MNDDGKIDSTELYVGVLLLYDRINTVPLVGRTPPPKRRHILKVLHNFDLNDSDTLDRVEFLLLAQELCKNVSLDVGKRAFVLLLLLPAVALPFKLFLVEVFAVFMPAVSGFLEAFPDHLFTSFIVSITMTALPIVEEYVWGGLDEMKPTRKARDAKKVLQAYT